ncbi:unnamed protein product [Urochloa decumbens]|uniref:Fe2OG dioxygenase domain-containing protein n=1 Tax=Urochloa decumbens TaxID=240449 RepID=A0ABC8VAF3_9POAL
MAAEALSNGAGHKSVPEAYVFPADKRPGSSPSCAGAIPVVDIDLGSDDPDRIVKQIMDAGREFDLNFLLSFSCLTALVINHGVPEPVIASMVASAEEFFRLPAEEKMALYSTDSKKLPHRLKLGIYPTEQFRQNWPDKPASLRAALEAYAPAVRAVALRILRLTAAGLGLAAAGYFEDGDELTAGPVIVNANHYRACPDPSLTMGLAPHCDPNVVTVLADNGVPGLQARRRGYGGGGGDGGWVDVAPVPGALVVNFGHQMELVSNGAMRAGEHRVVTDARAARTSVAAFFMPAMGCAVAAAPGTVAAGEKPLFRTFTYQEFMGAYTAVAGDRDAVMARFQNKD